VEELRIWVVDNEDAGRITPLDTAGQTDSEGLLEDILTRNPDLLEEGLQLVGRQTGTSGGPLDLLGVDRDGRLVVFELKRGTLNRDAVAQVIDYASDLDAMDPDSLYRHVAERSGNLGIQKIPDFDEWYSTNYPDHEPLTPARIVLIGMGVDNTTQRMVDYLRRSGMNVTLLTFHGFQQDHRILLARHVEVDSSHPSVGPARTVSRAQRFDERVRSLGVQDLVDAVTDTLSDVFRNIGVSFTRTHSTIRRHFCLDYSWRQANLKSGATLSIEVDDGGIMMGFQPVAVELATPAEFDRLGAEGVDFERTPKEAYLRYGQIDYGFKVSIQSLGKWSEHKEHLTALVQMVLAGYVDAKQRALSENGE
jgi:hypothetical protein